MFGSLEKRQNLDRVLRWLRSCPVCGTPWPPIDFLCGDCWKLAHAAQNEKHEQLQPDYAFPVYALWNWTPQTERVVKPLLYAFKRGWAAEAAMAFAQELHSYAAEGPRLFLHPPATDGDYDHSRLLADCFLRLDPNSEALELTRRQGDQARQKRKNAVERSQFRFEKVEKISAREGRYVFVDDVITTGSTATAAYMALDAPKTFEAWTLVARPKLNGTR